MPTLIKEGVVETAGKKVNIEDVSWMQKGLVFTYVPDTKKCPQIVDIAKDADLLLIESTYLDEHAELARQYKHLTAKQAGELAKKAGVKRVVLTHFSARYPDMQAFIREAEKFVPNVDVAEDFKVFPLAPAKKGATSSG